MASRSDQFQITDTIISGMHIAHNVTNGVLNVL